MRLDDAAIARVVAMLETAERPVMLDKVRLEREKRELAIDHADGRVGDDAYLSRIKEIRSRLASFDAPQTGQVPAKRAAAWLAALGETLQSEDPED